MSKKYIYTQSKINLSKRKNLMMLEMLKGDRSNKEGGGEGEETAEVIVEENVENGEENVEKRRFEKRSLLYNYLKYLC